MKALRSLFERLDTDQDAALSAQELVAPTPVLELGGLATSPELVSVEQRAGWLEAGDLDKDGQLDFQELMALVASPAALARRVPVASPGVSGGVARGELVVILMVVTVMGIAMVIAMPHSRHT